jgi:hypothetical protein
MLLLLRLRTALAPLAAHVAVADCSRKGSVLRVAVVTHPLGYIHAALTLPAGTNVAV